MAANYNDTSISLTKVQLLFVGRQVSTMPKSLITQLGHAIPVFGLTNLPTADSRRGLLVHAVAEELLFRGLFLTALQDSLGWVDAVAVCAALFAAIHLSLQQFFSFAVLGFGAGALTVRSNSVYPAILLHGSYNATALVVGLLHELHQ